MRDTELKGFLVRVTRGGAKSFCLEKRIGGRNVRKMIGRYPDMTVEAARRQAHIWLGLLAEGKNPFQEDDEEARNKLTLKVVLEDYLDARKGLRFQEAEILRPNRRPRPVEVSVQGQDRYQEGLYTVSADSFRPDRFERLEMAFPTLTPLNGALEIGQKEVKAWKGRKLA